MIHCRPRCDCAKEACTHDVHSGGGVPKKEVDRTEGCVNCVDRGKWWPKIQKLCERHKGMVPKGKINSAAEEEEVAADDDMGEKRGKCATL